MDVFYKVKIILQNRNRLTDLENRFIKQIYSCQGGRTGGKETGNLGSTCSLCCLTWITSKVLSSTGNCCQDLGWLCTSAKQKHGDISQKDKDHYNILTHIYGIYKDVNDNRICRTEKETQMYRTVF